MNRLAEYDANVSAVRKLIASAGLGCLLISDHSNVAWLAGGGRSYVSWAVEQGAARVLVTPTDVLLITSNNETRRLEAEEFAGLPWKLVDHPWWEGPARLLTELLSSNGPAGVDSRVPWAPDATILGPEIARLRVNLSDRAQERARALGKVVGETMSDICRAIEPGESEMEIAGRVVGSMLSRGAEVTTCLVAADERIYQWRHLLPTEKKLRQYAAISVCARHDGLIMSISRLVHFGQPSDDVLRRIRTVCEIDAALIEATRPGATSGQLFELAAAGYARAGYGEEWRNHHQGGLTGYKGREWFATPGGNEIIAAGQLVAWNPMLPGAKCEDTLLVGETGSEILTESKDFPVLEIPTASGVVRRPSLLIR
ncbi:MAG TPA: M24 family metallopeptidase [Chloroflexota bacterium]